MIFVNFKTYQESSGANAIALAKIIEEVVLETQIKIIPVVATTDIREVVQSIKLEVWTQKIDGVEFGAHTGSILPEAVLEDGALGTLLNHSENKFSNFDDLKKAVERAKEVGLKTLIFASDLEELKLILNLKPDFVSYEPPSLIGSKDKSVTSEEPEIVAQAVALAKAQSIPLIVGAGIHSQEDVRKSLELGATGVAVASDIIKAENPKQELLDLVEGFK